jgi:hypothetical protein
VSYSGGVFNTGAIVLEPFVAALNGAAEDYKLQTPRFSPAIGAALYAARASGSPLNVEALRRLDGQCRG